MSPPTSTEVRQVLARRADPAARRAFRLAAEPHAAGRALPYLAGLWTPTNERWKLGPLCHLAALAGHLPNLAHGDVPPGVALRRAGRQASTRVNASYRLPLPQAHRLLLAALRSGEPKVMDWDSLWDMYRWWDHPDLQVSERVRRRLLTQFYADSRTDSDDTSSGRPNGKD